MVQTPTPRKGKRRRSLTGFEAFSSTLTSASSSRHNQDEATILAPTVADSVEARLTQLHTLGVEAKERGGYRGRRAAMLLRELEVHLEEEWK